MASSEDEEEAAPRRSVRERKEVKRLGFHDGPSKRRRTENDSETESEPEGEAEEDEATPVEDEDDADDVFHTPGKKRRTSGGAGAKSTGKKRAARKNGAAKGAGSRGDLLKGEANIPHDNALFESIRHPRAAQADAISDWVQLYQGSDDGRKEALAELVNLMLRACGCNASVDEHEAVDLDGVTDKLEDIQEAFKKVGSKQYPLTAKTKIAIAFRKSLDDFLERLVTQADEAEILYDDDFGETLQTWLGAATSSKLRSFRHTATVIALQFVTALCDIAADRDKGLTKASRARDSEKANRSASKQRLQTLEENVDAAHQKKMVVEGQMNSVWTAIWMHRHRDAEPALRRVCVHALGQWMKRYPQNFIKGDYLKYLGWMLTDVDKDVRGDTVRSMNELYRKAEYLGVIKHFTERFKPRLLEMAISEVEMDIRIVAIKVLAAIAKHGMLDETMLDKLAQLIYHIDPEVRTAAASFFVDMVTEDAANREDTLETANARKKAGAASVTVDREEQVTRLRLKCLAEALLRHGKSLDKQDLPDADSQEDEDDARQAPHVGGRKSRVTDAVQALWATDFDSIKDWQALLGYITRDHSSSAEDAVEPALKLTDEEETALIEILVVAIRLTRQDSEATSKRDKDPSDELNDMTRELIKLLPRLFAKYKTDARRVADIMLLITIMDLDFYFSLRMITAYEQIWDDVVDAVASHTETTVFEAGAQAVLAMQATSSLSKTNDEKLLRLEEFLLSSIEEAMGDKGPITAGYTMDDLRKLNAAFSRLAVFIARRDLSSLLEKSMSEDGMTCVQVLLDFAERALQGEPDEDEVMESILNVLWLFLIWKARAVFSLDEGATESEIRKAADLQEKIVDRLLALVSSNATDAVKEWAFIYVVDLYTFFGILLDQKSETKADLLRPLQLSFDDETPFRLAGFVQAEVERCLEALGDAEELEPDQEDTATEAGSEIGDDEALNGKPAKKGRQVFVIDPAKSLSARQQKIQAMFRRVVASFVRCIHVGVLDVRHASVIFAHYGRFDHFYDESCRKLAEKLRHAALDEGGDAEGAATAIIDALKESSQKAVNGDIDSDTLQGLVKVLSAVLLSRTAGLAVKDEMPHDQQKRIHTELISHIIKTVASLIEQKASTAKKERALQLFKGLTTLTGSIPGKELLKIQSYLDEALKAAGIKPSTTGIWASHAAYVKKLASIMAKDDVIKGAARKRAANSAEADDADEPANKRKRGPRSKPKASSRRNDNGEEENQDSDDFFAGEILPARTTSRTRGSSSPNKRKRSPDAESDEGSEEPPLLYEEPEAEPADVDDDDDDDDGVEEPHVNGINGEVTRQVREDSVASQSSMSALRRGKKKARS